MPDPAAVDEHWRGICREMVTAPAAAAYERGLHEGYLLAVADLKAWQQGIVRDRQLERRRWGPGCRARCGHPRDGDDPGRGARRGGNTTPYGADYDDQGHRLDAAGLTETAPNAGTSLTPARPPLDAEAPADPVPSLLSRILPGGCILDVPSVPEAVWGLGEEILWAKGQALILAGPDGVGKTTVAGNLIEARLGLGPGSVLGLPVPPGEQNVLVLLMDRPQQAMASLARFFTEADRGTLDARLRIWRGPPPRTSPGTRGCSPSSASSPARTPASWTRSRTPR